MDFDSEAVIDFEEVKSRGERRAVFLAVQTLKDLGPDLPSPIVLDVAPTSRKPALVTARAQRRGAIAHDDVSVVAASSV